MENMPDNELNDLRQLVLKHKVCWDVWPVYYIDKNRGKVQIGFELDLVGIVSDLGKSPESAKSDKVLRDINNVAEWITSEEKQHCRSDINSFDNFKQYSPLRSFREDYKVGIKILHRVSIGRPVDNCEIECLADIEEKLKKLGAQKGHWKKLRNSR